MIAIAKPSTITSSVTLEQGSDCSVVESIEAYTSWLSQLGKANSTVRRAEQLLTAIVFDCMGCDRIDQFDADITVQFLEHQQDQGYAGKTIRTQIAELKRFSKWLVRSGRIESDPIANLKVEVDEAESADRAQVRFQRLFKMIEFVSNSRLGVTYKAINEACCEVSHVCERTTRRDIDLLINIGTFRKERNESRELILIKLNPFSRLSHLATK